MPMIGEDIVFVRDQGSGIRDPKPLLPGARVFADRRSRIPT